MSIEPAELEALFDAVPDVLFFVKDQQGRYTHVNITMVRRLGLKCRGELIGKRVNEVYPSGLSAAYAQQDARVLAGEIIDNLLEVHIFPNRAPGWGLTCKRPWRVDGEIRGVIGITRDLGRSDGPESQYEGLRLALAHLNAHYAENVRMQTLLDITGFSQSKLERAFRKVFQLSPQQVLTRLRMQIAMHRLAGAESVASIGQACGFSDQSAFTRQFKLATGMVPRDYRALLNRPEPNARDGGGRAPREAPGECGAPARAAASCRGGG
jgi:PAS domain S-box-containing protein